MDTSDFFDIDLLQVIDELDHDEEIIDRVRVWDYTIIRISQI
jgi:hypothetical protein